MVGLPPPSAGEYGAGWILGAGGPDAFATAADQAKASWRHARREGEPRQVAIGYVSLGDDAEEHARFTAAGCDEWILFPANPDLHQIDLIANATGLT